MELNQTHYVLCTCMCVINYTRVKIIINICMISSLKPQDAWHTLSLSPNPSSSLSPVARLPTWRRMMMTTPVRLPHSCCLACFNHVCGCSPSLRPPLSLFLSQGSEWRECKSEAKRCFTCICSSRLSLFLSLIRPQLLLSFDPRCLLLSLLTRSLALPLSPSPLATRRMLMHK